MVKGASAASPKGTSLWIIAAVAALAGGVGTAAVLSAGEFLNGARSEVAADVITATVLAGPDRPMPMGLVGPDAAPTVADFDVKALSANDPRFGGAADLGAAKAFALVDKKADTAEDDEEPVTLAALAETKRKPTKAVEAAAERKSASAGPITGRRTTNDDVNIRSGPNSRSPVIGVVPRNSAVDIVKCASWCEIVYGGKHGYIYSGFVGAKGSGQKSGGGVVAGAQTDPGKVKSSATLEPKRKWWPFGRDAGDAASRDSAATPAFN